MFSHLVLIFSQAALIGGSTSVGRSSWLPRSQRAIPFLYSVFLKLHSLPLNFHCSFHGANFFKCVIHKSTSVSIYTIWKLNKNMHSIESESPHTWGWHSQHFPKSPYNVWHFKQRLCLSERQGSAPCAASLPRCLQSRAGPRRGHVYRVGSRNPVPRAATCRLQGQALWVRSGMWGLDPRGNVQPSF